MFINLYMFLFKIVFIEQHFISVGLRKIYKLHLNKNILSCVGLGVELAKWAEPAVPGRASPKSVGFGPNKLGPF